MNTTNSSPWFKTQDGVIAIIAIFSIILSLIIRVSPYSPWSNIPLYFSFATGGTLLVFSLIKKIIKKEFGSDLLAGFSIITSLLLEEYLAGVFVILMLSGGEALEEYALKRASSVLNALSKRMPHFAMKKENGATRKVDLSEVQINDLIEILPHDICPVDGEIIEGFGSMDESFLTGEPYQVQKAPGSSVISGAMNGESVLLIRATVLPVDSRYQKIAQVIESQASKHVPMKRLGDMLGAWYTPFALFIALIAWFFSGDAHRFLSVIVIATPCPLLIAIPIALIGAISSAASRGIIIKNPAALEHLAICKTMILDKTGTLTYGKPLLTEIEPLAEIAENEILSLVASIEQYSKHPLAEGILRGAKERNVSLKSVSNISEKPGQGLTGTCEGRTLSITSRSKLKDSFMLPAQKEGLECIVLEDKKPIAVMRFRDIPRKESKAFVDHVAKHHGITTVKILSGDRIAEVSYLAQLVGIKDVRGDLSPEDKLLDIKKETLKAATVYIGDGINDAPALQAATVGIAIGTNSDITSEAADAVVMEPSLEKVDELLHISHRMRNIAIQSAVGGMALSVIGMGFASFGMLTPLAGAMIQEGIDVLAVFNSLRSSFPPRELHHDLNNI